MTKQRRKWFKVSWSSYTDFQELQHTVSETHPAGREGQGWGRWGKERERGREIFGTLCAKHCVLPNSRGQRVEWLSVGCQSQAPGSTIWHCPLKLCVLGLCLTTLSLCFLSSKIQVVMKIKWANTNPTRHIVHVHQVLAITILFI